jgi:hypothetical protein
MLVSVKGIYHYINLTFDDNFIPVISQFIFFIELKTVVRVQGAKRNVNFCTSTATVEFKPNVMTKHEDQTPGARSL